MYDFCVLFKFIQERRSRRFFFKFIQERSTRKLFIWNRSINLNWIGLSFAVPFELSGKCVHRCVDR